MIVKHRVSNIIWRAWLVAALLMVCSIISFQQAPQRAKAQEYTGQHGLIKSSAQKSGTSSKNSARKPKYRSSSSTKTWSTSYRRRSYSSSHSNYGSLGDSFWTIFWIVVAVVVIVCICVWVKKRYEESEYDNSTYYDE